MKGYINTKCRRSDGTYDSYLTTEVEYKDAPLWWHKQGLSYTSSGYGAKIPTRHMIKWDGKWRRVYCIIYSNSGTLYIGKKYDPQLTVSILEE